MERYTKNTRQYERIVRGFSNHRRIEIMMLLFREPELSLIEISVELKINFKTASEHTRRLAIAGLVLKRNDANAVRHTLSPRGKIVLKFLRTLE
ncbi:MAG: winged helix-turn-helix domain-containing protein [Patescibacteria group bacterium]